MSVSSLVPGRPSDASVESLEARVAALEVQVRALVGPRPAAEFEALRRLLAAAAAVLEGAEFSAAELVMFATDRGLPANDLRSALLAFVKRHPERTLVRRLGLRLARSVGVAADGLMLERAGQSRDGATYRVVRL